MSCLWACRRHEQYFLPAAKKGINHQIELAILRADRMGVKVLSLAALNKVSSPPCFYCLQGSFFFLLKKKNTARVLTAAVPIDRVHIPSCDGLVSSLASRCSRDACWHGHDARASMFWFGVEKFL